MVRKIFLGIGVFWTIMVSVWTAITLTNMIMGKDYHHAAVMDLLTLILANQAFDRARS